MVENRNYEELDEILRSYENYLKLNVLSKLNLNVCFIFVKFNFLASIDAKIFRFKVYFQIKIL